MLCNRWACFLASRVREAQCRIKLREPTDDVMETSLATVNFDISCTCIGSLSTSPTMTPITGFVSASPVASPAPGTAPASLITSPAPGSVSASPISSPWLFPTTAPVTVF